MTFSVWDILLLGGAIGCAIAYTIWFVTRGKLVSVLVATYMATMLVNSAWFVNKNFALSLGFHELYAFQLAVFAVLFILIFFVLSQVIFQSPVGSETFGTIPSILLALSQSGFLAAVIVSYLPSHFIRSLAQITKILFVGKQVFFCWALAPIVLLLLLGRKANRTVG